MILSESLDQFERSFDVVEINEFGVVRSSKENSIEFIILSMLFFVFFFFFTFLLLSEYSETKTTLMLLFATHKLNQQLG